MRLADRSPVLLLALHVPLSSFLGSLPLALVGFGGFLGLWFRSPLAAAVFVVGTVATARIVFRQAVRGGHLLTLMGASAGLNALTYMISNMLLVPHLEFGDFGSGSEIPLLWAGVAGPVVGSLGLVYCTIAVPLVARAVAKERVADMANVASSN